ncbi:hypothetical protein GWI33_017418 [Rhynchophorus ferrugineus]|uniref:Uncharacterized protein n=1 Tax=Rhynchophorus ferrugineus TaxID=354439 RepID=A0A834MLT1_RHYFE|nr:hypothetical protein GWI33_017418 [Rhynchophorus ferrugineus]
MRTPIYCSTESLSVVSSSSNRHPPPPAKIPADKLFVDHSPAIPTHSRMEYEARNSPPLSVRILFGISPRNIPYRNSIDGFAPVGGFICRPNNIYTNRPVLYVT